MRRNQRFLHFLVVCGVGGFSSLGNAQSYCISHEGAKLHVTADENSKVQWKPAIYTPVLGTGNRKEIHGIMWAEVLDSDSRKFWAQKHDLTTKLSCLVISVRRTILKSDPDGKHGNGKAKVAQRHEAFIDLGGEDGWTRVKDKSGGIFWVNLDHTWKAKNKMRISFEEK